MKIALIAPTYLPARRANTIQVMKMAQAFVGLGHNVRVYSPGFSPRKVAWGELAQQYGLEHPFEVEWLAARARLRRYDYAIRSVREARRWGTHIIYTRLPQAAAFASLIGVNTVYEVHDFPPGRMSTLLLRLFLRGRGKRRLVVITQALRNDLAAELGKPSSPPFTLVAPDGVDVERFADLPDPQVARNSLSSRHGWQLGFTAGYTGHFYPGRGVRLMLELANRLPAVTFLLVGGEAKDVERLRAEVESRRLENVILTGFIPNADLPGYQAACDLLLMPYQNQVEASSGGDIGRYLSPMKMFEYLACGRAILASNLPVLREVLNPSNAVLLPPDDIEAWIGAMQSLQIDPGQRVALGTQAREDAAQYTWQVRAARILDGLEL